MLLPERFMFTAHLLLWCPHCRFGALFWFNWNNLCSVTVFDFSSQTAVSFDRMKCFIHFLNGNVFCVDGSEFSG